VERDEKRLRLNEALRYLCNLLILSLFPFPFSLFLFPFPFSFSFSCPFHFHFPPFFSFFFFHFRSNFFFARLHKPEEPESPLNLPAFWTGPNSAYKFNTDSALENHYEILLDNNVQNIFEKDGSLFLSKIPVNEVQGIQPQINPQFAIPYNLQTVYDPTLLSPSLSPSVFNSHPNSFIVNLAPAGFIFSSFNLTHSRFKKTFRIQIQIQI